MAGTRPGQAFPCSRPQPQPPNTTSQTPVRMGSCFFSFSLHGRNAHQTLPVAAFLNLGFTIGKDDSNNTTFEKNNPSRSSIISLFDLIGFQDEGFSSVCPSYDIYNDFDMRSVIPSLDGSFPTLNSFEVIDTCKTVPVGAMSRAMPSLDGSFPTLNSFEVIDTCKTVPVGAMSRSFSFSPEMEVVFEDYEKDNKEELKDVEKKVKRPAKANDKLKQENRYRNVVDLESDSDDQICDTETIQTEDIQSEENKAVIKSNDRAIGNVRENNMDKKEEKMWKTDQADEVAPYGNDEEYSGEEEDDDDDNNDKSFTFLKLLAKENNELKQDNKYGNVIDESDSDDQFYDTVSILTEDIQSEENKAVIKSNDRDIGTTLKNNMDKKEEKMWKTAQADEVAPYGNDEESSGEEEDDGDDDEASSTILKLFAKANDEFKQEDRYRNVVDESDSDDQICDTETIQTEDIQSEENKAVIKSNDRAIGNVRKNNMDKKEEKMWKTDQADEVGPYGNDEESSGEEEDDDDNDEASSTFTFSMSVIQLFQKRFCNSRVLDCMNTAKRSPSYSSVSLSVNHKDGEVLQEIIKFHRAVKTKRVRGSLSEISKFADSLTKSFDKHIVLIIDTASRCLSVTAQEETFKEIKLLHPDYF